MKPVKDIKVGKNSTIKEVIDSFEYIGGFTAKKLWEAKEILNEMFQDDDIIKILSFPACIMATGVRGILTEVIKRRLFDIVITTCGTLDHDIGRTVKEYYEGYFEADDIELSKKGIHRLGNVFIPKESYGIVIEQFMRSVLEKMYKEKKNWGVYELIWKIGEEMGKYEKREQSFLYWTYKNKIPVIVPGITDGAVGTQIFMFKTEHPDFEVSVWKDEEFLSSILWGEKKVGALMLGGGISKHHTIWWAQFAGGLEYAVYITTAVEYDGSLSGARTREAISWGKLKRKAKHITVEGEITVLLPLLLGYFL